MRARTLKTSLPAICRAITRQKGIRLVFQGPPRTDGRTIYSNPLPITADGEDIEVIVGDIDHECAHILFTDFEHSRTVIESVEPARQALVKSLVNAAEDTVVERLQGEAYPGCRETLARSVEIVEARQETFDFSGKPPSAIVGGFVDAWGRVQVLGQDVRRTLTAARAALEDLMGAYGRLRVEALLNQHLVLARDTATSCRLGCALAELLEELAEEEPPPEQDKANTPTSDGGAGEPTPPPGSPSTADRQKAREGARQVLADPDVDETPLFDRRQASDEAQERARAKHFQPKLGGDGGALQGGESRDAYRQLRESVSAEIRLLQRRLREQYRTATRRRRVASEQGRIDGRRLARAVTGERRVFTERTRVELPQPAVSLLIDCSGSMAGVELQLAQQAAIAVAEVNDSLAVPTEIWAFGGTVGRVKAFEESLRSRAGILGGLVAGGGTPTAEVLWQAGSRLFARRERRRLMFLVTDGYPGDLSGAQEVAVMLGRSGIELYGIGIGCEAVANICPTSEVIDGPDRIGSALIAALGTRLLRVA